MKRVSASDSWREEFVFPRGASLGLAPSGMKMPVVTQAVVTYDSATVRRTRPRASRGSLLRGGKRGWLDCHREEWSYVGISSSLVPFLRIAISTTRQHEWPRSVCFGEGIGDSQELVRGRLSNRPVCRQGILK